MDLFQRRKTVRRQDEIEGFSGYLVDIAFGFIKVLRVLQVEQIDQNVSSGVTIRSLVSTVLVSAQAFTCRTALKAASLVGSLISPSQGDGTKPSKRKLAAKLPFRYLANHTFLACKLSFSILAPY